MSIFDMIPTVGEVLGKVACTLTDHDWKWNKIEKHYYCSCCGKIK